MGCISPNFSYKMVSIKVKKKLFLVCNQLLHSLPHRCVLYSIAINLYYMSYIFCICLCFSLQIINYSKKIKYL